MYVSPHVTLTYTNTAGDSVSMNFFDHVIPTVLREDVAQTTHSVVQSGVPGSLVTGTRAQERFIELRGEVRDAPGLPDEYFINRLERAFNQNLYGTLRYENANPNIAISAKEISCRLEKNPRIYWAGTHMAFDISLVSHEPWWRGRAFTQNIAETEKLWSFAHSVPQRRQKLEERPAGMVFAKRAQTLQSTFQNVGNVPAGFVATLRASGGTVVNPELVNIDTGQRIRVLVTMQPNDVVTILSTAQERRVFFRGGGEAAMHEVDSIHLLDRHNRDFFLIQVGANGVGFNADVNVSNLLVSLQYTPLFTAAEVLDAN